MVILLKVAFAQIKYKPAFFYNQNNLLIEPLGDTSTSITKLKYSGSDKLRTDLEQNYINWLKVKVYSIIRKAEEKNVQLLLFPEYSIPATIISDIISFLKDNNCNIILIAGTHIVTSNLKHVPDGYPKIPPNVGYALCPIVSREGIIDYTFKTHRAFEEINNIRIPSNEVKDTIKLDKYTLQIKICIDAITNGTSLDKKAGKIVAIPSMSRKTDPFLALTVLSKYNDIPIIYANNADVGGSMISGPFLQDGSQWFVEGTNTKPIPKGVECLVAASINLNNLQFGVGTVNITEPIKVDSVINLFYKKDDIDKQAIASIKKFLNDDVNFSEISNIRADAIFAEKIKIIETDLSNGVFIEDKAKELLDFIEVNSLSFEQMILAQANDTIKKISGNFSNASGDPLFIDNLAKISSYISKREKTYSNTDTDIFTDDVLFRGRETEITALGKFFDSDNPVLLVHGIRGIGKTKLLNNISTNVLPTPCPWDIKLITVEKGIGYSLLLDQIEYILGLTYIERKSVSPCEIAKKIYSQLEKRRPTIMIIDDLQNCTDVTGKFSDIQIKELLISLVHELKGSRNIKFILASSRKIQEVISLVDKSLEVTRLTDDIVRFIIGYCFRKITNSTSSMHINESTVNLVYGNPLAAILIALLVSENKLNEFEKKGDVFSRFQDQQIKNLIGEVTLSENEMQLMEVLSVSKGAAPYELIASEFTRLIPAIDSLANRFLIEKTDDYVKLHPLLGEYYTSNLGIDARTKYHRLYAGFYEEKHRTSVKKPSPLLLANAIYHFAGSLQFNKLKEYKLIYIDQLKPIADQFYKDKNYQDAIRYYEMIYDMTSNLRQDIFIRMTQCYVYTDNIHNADKFFELAVNANPRGAYLWAQYSIALSSKPFYWEKALELSLKAEDIYYQYGNSFTWELAKIKFAQAKAYRYNNIEKALPLYEEACDLDKTNVYYLCMYAKLLFESDRTDNAVIQLKKAEIIEPSYPLLLRLFNNYVKKTEITSDYIIVSNDEIEPKKAIGGEF